jgi:hypothetical protein
MDGDVEQMTPVVAVDACKVMRENNGALRERNSIMSWSLAHGLAARFARGTIVVGTRNSGGQN